MSRTGTIDERRCDAIVVLCAACAWFMPLTAHAQAGAPTRTSSTQRSMEKSSRLISTYPQARPSRPSSFGYTVERGGPAPRRSRRWPSSRTASPWPASTSGSRATRGFQPQFTTSRQPSVSAREGLRVRLPRRSDSDRRLLVGRPSRGARRRVEWRQGARGRHRRLSEPVVRSVCHHRLLRRLEPHDHSCAVDALGPQHRRPALELLLGALPDGAPGLAELASPVVHVDRNDPPLLMFTAIRIRRSDQSVA